MKKYTTLVLLGMLALLAGCAPRYRWAVDIRFDPVVVQPTQLEGKRVGVFIVSSDLGQQIRLETIFRKHLQKCSNVTLLSASTDIYPWLAGKGTDQERVETIRGLVDYLLVVESSVGVNSSTVYIPPSYNTTGSYSYNPYLRSGSFSYTTKQQGGETVTLFKPYGNFALKLVSFREQDSERPIMWMAGASAGGNAFAEVQDLFELLAYKTVKAWAEAGMCTLVEDPPADR